MDVHNYAKKIETMQAKIATYQDGPLALSFLAHLRARGLSEGRVHAYAIRLATVLRLLDQLRISGSQGISLQGATRSDVENLMALINRGSFTVGKRQREYKPWTKAGLAITLKKFVQYAKTGRTDKDQPYPLEVSWIKPKVKEDDSRATPDKVLSEEDFLGFISHVSKPRDRALLYVFYEGAFRPGELLTMKVGSVEFLDKYCVVNTKGKTGEKRIPLVISMLPLVEWLRQHPRRDDPEAPLWPSLSTNRKLAPLGYISFRRLIKDTAKEAGLKTDVWPYLFRHSRLTFLGDKLTEARLDQFAGWTIGSKMPRRYIHWSGRDLDGSVLNLYGIKSDKEVRESILKPKACPRCQTQLMPEDKRCGKCGLIVDPVLAAKNEARKAEKEAFMQKRLEKVEGQLAELLSRSKGGAPVPPSKSPQGSS